MRETRVRFAPSPTGALHIGGVRTALYNYLLARKTGGKMLLRIEDTDQSRFVEGAEEYIKKSLDWLGIDLDEGPDQGGEYGPYRQSYRKEIYIKYIKQLIDTGNAYYAFDTPEQLEDMRDRIKNEGGNAQYGCETRAQMHNSLTLSATEVARRLEAQEPYVIRVKIEPNQQVVLHDLIRGEVAVNSTTLDDKVLMKSDGMPTYHLANVVDDYLMKISHVIRGEEWLPSAPLHVLLYRYFGWEKEAPQFAHLPLLLKPNGNGKLSKRDADQMGFPIFPLNWTDPTSKELAVGFKESGYLPEALINFLAFLGWNPGGDQEIFSISELTQAFSLERIGKAGAKFDIEKAKWYNQHYLRSKSNEELAELLHTELSNAKIDCSKDKEIQIVKALKERVTFPKDFYEMGMVFFEAPKSFDEKIASKKWTSEAVQVLSALISAFPATKEISAETAHTIIQEVSAKQGVGQGKVMPALRLALTGGASGPDLMTTIEILGVKETQKRLSFALTEIRPND
ncbi:MAG: glutamate--tRNA ligase [Cyclobacteriaceae bacterium]